MERLTRRIDGVVVYVGTKNPYSTGQIPCEVDSAGVREMMYRLAAYEDKRLTPESVEALKLSMMGKAISEITEFNGLPIDRLRELAEADKDGRLVVLPCKVGDTVYFALLGRIIEKQVFSIVSFSNSTRIYCGGTSEYFRPEDIGKTFFLTREEAEKALEAMKDD